MGHLQSGWVYKLIVVTVLDNIMTKCTEFVNLSSHFMQPGAKGHEHITSFFLGLPSLRDPEDKAAPFCSSFKDSYTLYNNLAHTTSVAISWPVDPILGQFHYHDGTHSLIPTDKMNVQI